MTDLDLDLRLVAAARSLDGDAPAFDVARLPSGRPRRLARRHALVLACVVAIVGVVAAPAAVSAIGDLFEVEEVPVIGTLEPGVAAPFAGRSVRLDDARAATGFRIRQISGRGAPHDTRIREDITGGMVTLVYEQDPWVLLTQWRTSDVSARIAVVPGAGSVENVTVAGVPGAWTEGEARGTFTLVGADGTVHRESFDVRSGALLWRRAEMTYLLQGAGTMQAATSLATDVEH